MRVVSGKARGIVLKAPNGFETRPTADRVKEAMFSILQFDLPGAAVLDLFGGTGQLGIEALSRGANKAVFVDQSDAACRLIRENLNRTHMVENARVVRSDYTAFLNNCRESFDIIILDPPYAEKFLEKSLKLITEIDILQSDGIIVAEYPAEKSLEINFLVEFQLKEYKYGNTKLMILRKNSQTFR